MALAFSMQAEISTTAIKGLVVVREKFKHQQRKNKEKTDILVFDE